LPLLVGFCGAFHLKSSNPFFLSTIVIKTITKRIIEHQNGKIEVESNIENGTTFTIKLPLLES
jgi:light-regulated signal transduction histidine kinase (bacteriophytochrome)